MILADKILSLRRNAGWSQEELAEKLSVSRQSVSKWESAGSIPDMGKILEMSRLFGVSTDYLLKDELEQPAFAEGGGDSIRTRISLETAMEYLASRVSYGRQIALGVVLCILAPVMLILLAGISEYAPRGILLSEGAAAGVGLLLLFLLIAAAVALFIVSSSRERKWKALEKDDFELEYGVCGVVGQKREEFQPGYVTRLVIGVCLCILSPVPLIGAGLSGAGDFTCILFTIVMLLLVACAVWLFITVSEEKSGYDRLLRDGDYDPAIRENARAGSRLAGFYWPAVTAVYLLWSFLTNDWKVSWLVWPVAALLFAGISAALKKER